MLAIGSKTNFGIIEDEFEDQFYIHGQWVLKSLVKEVSELSPELLKEIMINELIKENGAGYIKLYHGTDINSYNKIMESQTFGDGERIYFMTNKMKEAKDYSIMKSKYRGIAKGKVLTMKVPKYAVSRNSGTGEYETKFKLQFNGECWIPVL